MVYPCSSSPVTVSSSPEAAGSAETSSTAVAPEYQRCSQCHPRQCAELAASAHAGLDCLGCHGAHGAGDRRPAREVSPEACYDCHPDFLDRSRFHLADGSVTDRVAGRPLTCTSSCHDAHGTTHVAMLRQPYMEGEYGTDGLCLSCHPRVGIDF
jgi:predicted CXXCH cytochrome family protein